METSVLRAEANVAAVQTSGRTAVWIGRVLSGLSTAFLTFDALIKIVAAKPAVEGTAQLGFPESSLTGMGAALLAGVVAYVVPRTSALGALILTGYLGGAVAAQVRVGNPLFSHALFPIYVAVMIWGGLVLRDERVRAVFFRGRSS